MDTARELIVQAQQGPIAELSMAGLQHRQEMAERQQRIIDNRRTLERAFELTREAQLKERALHTANMAEEKRRHDAAEKAIQDRMNDAEATAKRFIENDERMLTYHQLALNALGA